MSPQIHLFDIDIPGKITFIESKTLTAGETPTIVDTGLTYSFIDIFRHMFPSSICFSNGAIFYFVIVLQRRVKKGNKNCYSSCTVWINL